MTSFVDIPVFNATEESRVGDPAPRLVSIPVFEVAIAPNSLVERLKIEDNSLGGDEVAAGKEFEPDEVSTLIKLVEDWAIVPVVCGNSEVPSIILVTSGNSDELIGPELPIDPISVVRSPVD